MLHEEFEVLPEFSHLASQLVTVQFLWKEMMLIDSKNRIYYYFLALYLHQHLDDTIVHGVVQRMASELYREESASTLLFLSHLTKDRRVPDTLLCVCEEQFASAPEASLNDDVNFVTELCTEIERITLSDEPLKELRGQELERHEKLRLAEIEYEEVNQKELEARDTLLGRLNAAIKTIQILGQYLKNFPANLEKFAKDRIISAAAGLARRVVGEGLSLISTNQTELLNEMMVLIGMNRDNLSEEKLRR